MSVINDVLKDLQNRESRFTPLELAADGVAAATPPARRSLLVPLVLVTLLVLAGAWLYQLQWPWSPAPGESAPVFDREVSDAAPPPLATPAAIDPPAKPATAPARTGVAQAPAGQPASAAAAADPAPAADADAAPAPANAIVGLQLRESADELRIEFMLRERAVAYLKQRDRNGFVYRLGEIESRIAAPDISGNRWLERLSIDGADGGVDIRFVTAPDVLVDTGQARGDGEFVWAISLRHSPPPSTATRATAPAPAEAQAPGPGEAVAAAPAGPAERAPRGDQAAAAEPAEVRLDIRTNGPASGDPRPLQRARESLEAGRYVDAERQLRDLLGSPQDYDARRQLLALYEGRGQDERLALLARDSAARYSDDDLFVTEYARSLFRGGDYFDVIRLLAGQERLDARQQSLLGVSYQRLGRHGDAVRHFRLALTEDDALARSWIGLGISLEQSAAPDQALDAYRRALALGDLNQRLREFAQARRDQLRRVTN